MGERKERIAEDSTFGMRRFTDLLLSETGKFYS
jgi:hypothetical protein